MFWQCSEVVISNLQRAIDKLEAEGVRHVFPDMKNPDWWWGCQPNPDYNPQDDPLGIKKTILLPDAERKSVFLSHLKRFLDKALNIPTRSS